MDEHQAATCRKTKHHVWTKWEDGQVSWLYVSPRGDMKRLRRQARKRHCTRCDKKEVQVTDVFAAAE